MFFLDVTENMQCCVSAVFLGQCVPDGFGASEVRANVLQSADQALFSEFLFQAFDHWRAVGTAF